MSYSVNTIRNGSVVNAMDYSGDFILKVSNTSDFNSVDWGISSIIRIDNLLEQYVGLEQASFIFPSLGDFYLEGKLTQEEGECLNGRLKEQDKKLAVFEGNLELMALVKTDSYIEAIYNWLKEGYHVIVTM